MLLSDEEIEACALQNMGDTHNAVRAIEAAILAKLASAELPTTVWVDVPHFTYTADQLTSWGKTRFAQGAAAQLAEKPSAYELSATKYANGRELVYTVPDALASYIKVEPLYTRREA